jgi:hypothetical protein
MHVIPPAKSAIFLFSREGLVRQFESHSEALTQLSLRWISENVGRYFHEYLGSGRALVSGEVSLHYQNAGFVLRDTTGQPLVAKDFYAARRAMSPLVPFSWNKYALWNGEGPVPGTGRRGSYRQFRNPGTQALRRSASHFEGEPPIRARRNATNLPSSWDDVSRKDRQSNSWKRYRKTQWKA